MVGRFSKSIISGITGLFLMAGTAAAAPVVIDFIGTVDFFNPGPFTQNVALGGQRTLDDIVVATGPNNTFNNVITGFSLTIAEPGGPVFIRITALAVGCSNSLVPDQQNSIQLLLAAVRAGPLTPRQARRR